ncbi:ABC transporter substrate-binding protein [Arcanobacterium buesumense]|uniref:Sugar ABC transporter substrate-binding protein n=1 Tax=Arcanobacterium buesumense TaxID=2722751 RepID=A0A6H2EJL2_9ACTO|nr:sugar ABC transporter substrate-binding protein [Arcanobacterium buesumense]QJC21334.1 sugar ABC transporter substrate-binding protein [Arcanobacterium buesumense]
MHKKLFAGLLAGAMSIAGLASCSSDADSTSSLDGELAGDIVFWSSYTQGPRSDYLKSMADRFMEENPKVKIKIENFSWSEFNTKWTTGISTGQVPDLSSALPNQVTEMIDVDALVPLDDVIADIGKDRFYEAALAEGEKDGEHYSIPLYSHAQLMWYRTDLLDKAGLEVPQTWDELAKAADTLSDDETYGLSVPLGTNDMMATRFLNFYVKSAGKDLIAKDGTIDLTNETVYDGIRYWVDRYKKSAPEGSLNFNILDQATLFYQGKTAFDFNSGFHIGGVESTTPELADKIAAAPLPRMNADDPIYGGETTNQPMVVWKNSKHPEVAKAFLKTLYQTDDYIKFLHSVPVGMMPALKDIVDNPDFLNNDHIEKYRSVFDSLNEVIPLGQAIGMEQGPQLQAGIVTSQGIIEQMFHSIILDGESVEKAAKTAEDKLNDLFKKAGAIK